MRKCLPRNLDKPISVTLEREIVMNTKINPTTINYVGVSFISAIENNVDNFSKEVKELIGELAIAKQQND